MGVSPFKVSMPEFMWLLDVMGGGETGGGTLNKSLGLPQEREGDCFLEVETKAVWGHFCALCPLSGL